MRKLLILSTILSAGCGWLPSGPDDVTPYHRAAVPVWEAPIDRVWVRDISFEKEPAYPEVRAYPTRLPARLPVVTEAGGVLVPAGWGISLLNVQTGEQVWTLDAWQTDWTQALSAQGRIVLYESTSGSARLRVISEQDGSVRHVNREAPPGAVLSGDENRVYLCHAGGVSAFDARTVMKGWSWEVTADADGGGRMISFTANGFGLVGEYFNGSTAMHETLRFDYARGTPAVHKLGRVVAVQEGRVYHLREKQGEVWVWGLDGVFEKALNLNAYDGRAMWADGEDLIYTTTLRHRLPAAMRITAATSEAIPATEVEEPSVLRIAPDGRFVWHAAVDGSPRSRLRLEEGVLVEAFGIPYMKNYRMFDRLRARDARTGVLLWDVRPGSPVDEFCVRKDFLFTLHADGMVRAYRY